MLHLFIRTLKPSHTESFWDEWTFSLEDSHANPSAKLGLDKQLKTLVTSSHTSPKESESANLELFSSKMYKESSVVKLETENQFSNMSLEHWKKWVTKQRQEFSHRQKLALLTKENESSSSQWLTPTGMDISRTKEGIQKRMEYRKSIGRKYMEGCLTEQVTNWATPKELDSRKQRELTNGENVSHTTNTKYGIFLEQQATQLYPSWATPMARDYKDSPNDKGGRDMTLGRQVNGLTPNTQADPTNHKKSGKPQESWSTPRASATDSTRPNGKGGIPLAQQAKENQPKGYLNPDWVEQLMGLPIGWTDSDF
jgi:hypothetical protein